MDPNPSRPPEKTARQNGDRRDLPRSSHRRSRSRLPERVPVGCQQLAGSNVTERSTEPPELGHEGTVRFSGASRRSSGDLLLTETRRASSALLPINSAAFQHRRPLPIPSPANRQAVPDPRNPAPPRMLPPGCASSSRAAGGHGGGLQCRRGGNGGAGGRGRVRRRRRRRRGEPGCPAGLRLSKRGPSSRPARLLYGNRNLSAPGLYVLQPWIVGLLVNHEQPDGKKWLTGQVLRVGICVGERPCREGGGFWWPAVCLHSAESLLCHGLHPEAAFSTQRGWKRRGDRFFSRVNKEKWVQAEGEEV